MKKWLGLALLIVLVLPLAPQAQTAPVIEWQHTGVGVSSFKCVVDGGMPSDLGLPTPSGGWYSSTLSNCTGVMVNGTHSVVIQACNTAGCTSATALTVVKL